MNEIKKVSIDELAVMIAKGFMEMDKRFIEMDKRFDKIETQMSRIGATVDDHEHRLDKVETHLHIA